MNALLRVVAPALLCASLTACSDVLEPPADEADESVRYSSAAVAVSGSVVFSNGRNICNQFPEGFVHSLRILRVVPDGTDVSVATPSMTCPNNSFAVSLEPGDYLIRGLSDALVDPASRFPRLPWSTLTVTGPVSDVLITYANGRSLGGRVTIDGEPVAGVAVNFRPTITDFTASNFSSFSVTHADGTFGERGNTTGPMVRDRTWLQPGIEYSATCGTFGGAVLASSSPSPFLFGDVTSFNCRFLTSKAAAWTHDATLLDVTAGPGYFGLDGFGDAGYGYGVQYPSTTPDRNLNGTGSHMFDGGFLIAVDGKVLSTFDVQGHMACATCLDFTPVRDRPQVIEGAGGAKEIAWNLTDEGSAESAGLTFQQRSFDGTGGDYVLFRVLIRNTSDQDRTFSLGFFADWDVGMSFSDHSAGLNGDIAYSARPGGPVLGSIFFGDFPTRGFFGAVNSQSLDRSVAAQVGRLDGSLTSSSVVTGFDVQYTHSVANVKLRAGRQRVFWFALVAGADQAGLIANAAAAEADMNARLGG